MSEQSKTIQQFLTADDEGRFALLEDSDVRLEIQAWMGKDALDQLMAQRTGAAHLGGGPKNIIFAPGVMGSTLQSEGLGGVWWLDMLRARDKLNQLELSDDGLRDIDEDSDVRPGAVDLSYVAFRKAVAVSGVFGGSVQFPYDWRKSLFRSADLLRQKITEVSDQYNAPVHLVGHSMGGLMIRSALMGMDKSLWKKIGKIVFIGTPHYGSGSIAGYLKNHLWGFDQLAVLGMFLSRDTFRSLRGVLSLLPAPSGIYPGTRDKKNADHPCANFDLYDARAWKLDLDAAATTKLQNVLDEVRDFHTSLYSWHDGLLQDFKDRMLVIAGVGQETLFRLEFDSAFWGLWEHTKKITERKPCDDNRDGDGRVPIASAHLEDVAIRYVAGEHGGLPNIPAVAADVLAWLQDKDLKLSKTCAGGLGSHLGSDVGATPVPQLDGSAVTSKYVSLSDYEHPTPEFRAAIERELDAGRLPGVNLVKIL